MAHKCGGQIYTYSVRTSLGNVLPNYQTLNFYLLIYDEKIGYLFFIWAPCKFITTCHHYFIYPKPATVNGTRERERVYLTITTMGVRGAEHHGCRLWKQYLIMVLDYVSFDIWAMLCFFIAISVFVIQSWKMLVGPKTTYAFMKHSNYYRCTALVNWN